MGPQSQAGPSLLRSWMAYFPGHDWRQGYVGTDLELTEMLLITLGMSALIGIVGTFTENVGI